jgi:TonB family protein
MRNKACFLVAILFIPCSAWAGQNDAGSVPAQPEPEPVVRAAHSTEADRAVPLCPGAFNDSLEKDGIAAPHEPGVQGPTPIKPEVAEITPEARRAIDLTNGEGFRVVMSFVVDANGMPQNVCIAKSAGYGLDANSASSAMKARFRPATKDGKPVAMRIKAQMTFRSR